MDKRYFNSKAGLILNGCLGILFRCGAAGALYKADKLDMELPDKEELKKDIKNFHEFYVEGGTLS
ncbi:MAG: hypothetical protein KAT65_27685 [Methanophagales archaeon]|nr:hypothetical protein [Methanophagales archaeon]